MKKQLLSTLILFFQISFIQSPIAANTPEILNEAITAAQNHALEILELDSQISHLELNKKLLSLLYLPTLNLQYQSQNSIIHNAKDRNWNNLSIQLQQPLPSGTKLWHQLTKIKNHDQILQLQKESLKRQIASKIRLFFSQLYLQEVELNSLIQNEEDLTLLKTIIQKKVELESARKIDFERIEINLQRAKNKIIRNQNNRKNILTNIKFATHWSQEKISKASFMHFLLENCIAYPLEEKIPQLKELLLTHNLELSLAEKKLQTLKIEKEGLFLNFIPEMEYKLNWNQERNNQYASYQNPSHQLSFKFNLPGISLNQNTAFLVDSKHKELLSLNQAECNPKGWFQIGDISKLNEAIRLQREKMERLKEHLLNQFILNIDEIKLVQSSLTLFESDIATYRQEKLIGEKEYQLGEIPLFELNEIDEKLQTALQEYHHLSLKHFELYESLLLLCGLDQLPNVGIPESRIEGGKDDTE